MNYDFTTSQSQAWGSNQTASAPHGFYGGDVNNDSTIDLTDIVRVFNDASLFASGCRVRTDVNSDQFVDLSDLVTTFNNSSLFVSVVSPCPEPRPTPETRIENAVEIKTKQQIERNGSKKTMSGP